MGADRAERKLTAILAADVAGYSRLMGEDDEMTLASLTAHRRELFDPSIAEHRGRLVKTTGDGLLAEFGSVVDAVRCAVAVQAGMAKRNSDVTNEKRLEFRIGINVGDVVEQDGDLFGDGVNIAARLEAIAEPGGIVISSTVRDHIGSGLGSDIEDIGEQALKNIARPIRAYRLRQSNAATNPAERATLSLPDKPSIAVLPFDNLSGDPEQGYFTDGITEDIITDLSKVSGLFIISRNSSFAYKGQDVRKVSSALGVRYVLEGSVRRAAGRVRINAQMIDGVSGGHVWAERFDRDLADIFAVQDEVTRAIVHALRVRLTTDEEARRENLGKIDPEVYELLTRANQNIQSFRPEGIADARPMLERALERDPENAVALSRLAITYCLEYINDWNPRPDHLERALAYARRAVDIDRNEPNAHYALALTYLWMRQLDEAEIAAEQLIELSPSLWLGYDALGNVRDLKGDYESARELYVQCGRLNPWFDLALHFEARALAGMGRFAEAEALFKRRLLLSPRSDMTRFYLASVYGNTGRHEEARQLWREILEINPNFSVENYRRKLPYRDPEWFAKFTRGLAAAGITV
jgi:adenylate cyclase